MMLAININNRFRLVGPPQNSLYDTQEGVYCGPESEVRLFASWTPQPAALAVRRLYSPGAARYRYLSDEEKEIVDSFLAGYKAPPVKEGHIHLRVAMDSKNAYVKAAQAEGKSLSTWICDNLNQAIT
jgi:predicted HicB family RNase H-like nuclease